MFDIKTLLVLIPAMPLAGALVAAVLGKRVLRQRSHIPVVTGIGLAFLLSVVLLARVRTEANRAEQSPLTKITLGYEQIVTLWSWATVDQAYSHPTPGQPTPPPWRDFRVDIALRADPLTATMLAMVTLISTLVAVYSIGYMHDDPGYWRFFSYIGLFVFSMTMLVSASNFLLLYVFWEAVGLCSYLLIGFWFEKPSAAAAGFKAFLANRVGDFGFALGVFLLWTTYGTLDFHDTYVGGALRTAGVLGQLRLQSVAPFVGGGVATAICLLLMLGACGKSAQFPLHVWLPDAMEGPSPVSALIHAATMVTAGVYMVARCMPLFTASADAPLVVATIGGFTAIFAALIALTQNDMKRILAYSTISQLGYMFLGLGAATLLGLSAGMFHLLTHAFFKALLFLAAGSVMHAMGGVIDIQRLGGLRRRLPTTHWTFLFGALALAGIFPFAGFWSKDAILEATLHASQTGGPAGAWYGLLYGVAVAAACLTAFYTFRAYFLVFFGPERIPEEAGHHAHESPPVMTWPLIALAVGALVIGALLELTGWLADFLSLTPSVAALAGRSRGLASEVPTGPTAVMITGTLVAVGGIAAAAVVYLGPRTKAERLGRALSAVGLYQLSYGKFFIDQVYQALVVWPLTVLAGFLAWIDRIVIDGLVDACGAVPPLVGRLVRPLQGGVIQFYALGMLLGLLVLLGVLLL